MMQSLCNWGVGRKALFVLVQTVALVTAADTLPPRSGPASAAPRQEAQTQAQESTESNLAELRRKAEAGDAKAQYNLGICYTFGQGVPKDAAEAVKWFRKAAD